ncbi:MAG TPA: hypothetical protein VN366_04740 [Feifaniaceae bacterium]|nr:hypothetical protein [Feifaniaceae bacterium]
MISVLGLELSAAKALLEKEGYAVVTAEVSSKKGVPGNERRVVRERKLPEEPGQPGRICLTYAVFRTDVGQ